MNFQEWWKLLKPAECDEVKPQFEDCWQQAYAAGREAMRQECVKFFQALAGTNWTAGTVADTIKELK